MYGYTHCRDLNGTVLNGRIVTLDTGLEQACVTKDQDARGSHEPEECADRRRYPKEWYADDKQASVEVFLCYSVFTELRGLGS